MNRSQNVFTISTSDTFWQLFLCEFKTCAILLLSSNPMLFDMSFSFSLVIYSDVNPPAEQPFWRRSYPTIFKMDVISADIAGKHS